MEFFDSTTPGELNSIINQNTEILKVAIGYKLAEFIRSFTRGLGCIVYSMLVAWKFSIIFLPIIPLIFLSSTMMIASTKKYTKIEMESYGKSSQVAQEALSAIRTVIAFGLENTFVSAYENKLLDSEKMGIKKGFLVGIFESIFCFFYRACFGIGIVYAIYLNRIDCKNYYPGNLISAFYTITTATASIGQSLPYLTDLIQGKEAIRKILDIIRKKSKLNVTTKSKLLENFKGSISFQNVYFSYPKRVDLKVLKGFTLSIPAGKTVAFCGHR